MAAEEVAATAEQRERGAPDQPALVTLRLEDLQTEMKHLQREIVQVQNERDDARGELARLAGEVDRLRTTPSAPPRRRLANQSPASCSLSPSAAAALGISDDLVYELTEQGDLPCLHLGRRKVIPTRAIDLIIDHALHGFDPAAVLSTVAASDDAPARPTRR